MRVNVIGTYNVLEAALATKDTLERFVEFSTSEVFGQHAFNVAEGHVTAIGSVGEARWTYAVSKLAGEHMAHAYHDELGLPTVSVRPFNIYGPGQIGGGAIRAFIEAALDGRRPDDPRRRLADPRVDATSTTWSSGLLLALEHPDAVGESFNIGNAALGGDDLRPRDADQAADGVPGRDRLPAAPLHRRRAAHPERRRRRASCSASRPRSSSTRGSSGRSRGTASGSAPRVSEMIRLAWPDVGEAELAAIGEVLESGQLTMGPGRRVRGAARRRVRHGACRRRLVRARPRSTSRCSRSGSARATR